MKHIENIMAAMQRRFGVYPLKEGQDIKSLQASWERALGLYSPDALTAVAKHWADTAKYPRWPEVGELLEGLKDWGFKPVKVESDNRQPEVIAAEQHAASWHRWLCEQASPAVGLSNTYILSAILNEMYPPRDGRKPLPFHCMLTGAFMYGALPDQWEQRRDSYVEKCRKMAAMHREACAKYGVARVNESKGAWVQWITAA